MSNDPGKSGTNRPSEPLPRTRPATPSTSAVPAGESPRRNTPPASSAGNAPRPARPQTPAHPTADQRLEGVLETQSGNIQSIDSVIPSGLSTSTYLPSARRNPELEHRLLLRRRYQFRQTIIPSSIVLSVSTLAFAICWFMMDPTSALRDNPLGKMIPLTLAILSAAFGIISALLIGQASSLRKAIRPLDEN